MDNKEVVTLSLKAVKSRLCYLSPEKKIGF